jgi:hypothetical protein
LLSEVVPLRRILLLFSLLAVVLVGLGDGSATLLKSRFLAGQAILSTMGPASGLQTPPRCCAKHGVRTYAIEVRLGAFEALSPAPKGEPSPWPDVLAQVEPVAMAGVPSLSPGHLMESQPKGLPAPLQRSCVLRI